MLRPFTLSSLLLLSSITLYRINAYSNIRVKINNELLEFLTMCRGTFLY